MIVSLGIIPGKTIDQERRFKKIYIEIKGNNTAVKPVSLILVKGQDLPGGYVCLEVKSPGRPSGKI
jgi:F420-0:gamma-glutamyl ligase-like protein